MVGCDANKLKEKQEMKRRYSIL